MLKNTNRNKRNGKKKAPARKGRKKNKKPQPYTKYEKDLICSYLNPWCQQAQGARIADIDTSDSVPFWATSTVQLPITGNPSTITGQTDGQAFFLACASEVGCILYAGASDWSTTVDGTVIGTGLTANVIDSNMTDDIQTERWVNGGMFMQLSDTPTGCSGIIAVTVMTTPQINFINLAATYNTDVSWQRTHYFTALEVLKNGGIYIPFTVDDPMNWQTYSGAAGVNSSGLSGVQVRCSGLSATATIVVRMWSNIEGKPMPTSVLHKIQSPSPSSCPRVHDALGEIGKRYSQKQVEAPWRNALEKHLIDAIIGVGVQTTLAVLAPQTRGVATFL